MVGRVQCAHDGRADHAAMAGHEDACFGLKSAHARLALPAGVLFISQHLQHVLVVLLEVLLVGVLEMVCPVSGLPLAVMVMRILVPHLPSASLAGKAVAIGNEVEL